MQLVLIDMFFSVQDTLEDMADYWFKIDRLKLEGKEAKYNMLVMRRTSHTFICSKETLTYQSGYLDKYMLHI